MGCNQSSLLPAELMNNKYVKDVEDVSGEEEMKEIISQKSAMKSQTTPVNLASLRSSGKSTSQFRKLSTKASLNSYLFTNGTANRRNQIIEIRKDTQEIKCKSCEYKLEFCCLSLGGFKESKGSVKPNQDYYIFEKNFGRNNNRENNSILFGVFDGHGKYGEKCSSFVGKNLANEIRSHMYYDIDTIKAIRDSYNTVNEKLHSMNNEDLEEEYIDDTMSGTTAVCLLFKEGDLYISNVGDSRAICGIKVENEKMLLNNTNSNSNNNSNNNINPTSSGHSSINNNNNNNTNNTNNNNKDGSKSMLYNQLIDNGNSNDRSSILNNGNNNNNKECSYRQNRAQSLQIHPYIQCKVQPPQQNNQYNQNQQQQQQRTQSSLSYTLNPNKNYHLEALNLSIDQSPYREDEYERLLKCGAEIMTIGQKKNEVSKDLLPSDLKNMKNDGDRCRIWIKDKNEPGCEYSRSIGDKLGESIGVICDPEVFIRNLNEEYEYFVIASDGVFEFLTNEDVIRIIEESGSVLESCQNIVSDSRNLWLHYDNKSDDITVIVIKISDFKRIAVDNVSNIILNHRTRIGSQITLDQKPVRNPDNYNYNYSYVNNNNNSNITMIGLSDVEMNYQLKSEYTGIPEYKDKIYKALKSQFIFKNLNDEIINGLVNEVIIVQSTKNEVIINSEMKCDKFYIAVSGKYCLIIKDSDNNEIVYEYKVLNNVFPSFGDMELLYDRINSNEIKCLEDGELYAITKIPFRSVALKYVYNEKINILKGNKCFNSLKNKQIEEISKMMEEKMFRMNDIVLEDNGNEDNNDNIYFVTEGVVVLKGKNNSRGGGEFDVLENSNSDNNEINENKKSDENDLIEFIRLGTYECFGYSFSLASSNGSDKNFSFKYISLTRVKCFILSKSYIKNNYPEIESKLKSINNKRLISIDHKLKYNEYIKENNLHQLSINDIELIHPLYSTSYHSFYSYRNKNSYCLGTIRITSLDKIRENKIQTNVNREKLLYSNYFYYSINYDTVFYIGSFHNKNNIYTLFNVKIVSNLENLIKCDNNLEENEIKYIFCSIVSKLKNFYDYHVMVRSIVPSLLSIDNNGNIIFCDLLNSKIEKNHSFTLCIDTEYMEPRMVTCKGHDYRCDIWCLGILLYELYTKHTPFKRKDSDTSLDIINNIMNYTNNTSEKIENYHYKVSELGMKLIERLLERRTSKRIGCESSSRYRFNELLDHEWFKGYNYADIENHNMISPLYNRFNKLYDEYSITDVEEKESNKLLEDSKYDGNEKWLSNF